MTHPVLQPNASVADSPRLGIIGCGKLARTLARLWHESQVFAIGPLYSQRQASACAAQAFIGAGQPLWEPAPLPEADIWLLATPDDQLDSALQVLIASGRLKQGTIVFHCSGSVSSRCLAPAHACGARIASIHPVHSFADPHRSLATFAGSWCACEGDMEALAVLKPAFTRIGGHLFAVDAEAKALYHAGSVMACNYLVTLLEAALGSFALAGVDRAQAAQLLGPLVHQTVDNVLGDARGRALTGPVARGDHQTVLNQSQQLNQQAPDIGHLYQTLGWQTALLARETSPSSAPGLARIIASLQPNTRQAGDSNPDS